MTNARGNLNEPEAASEPTPKEADRGDADLSDADLEGASGGLDSKVKCGGQ